MLRRLFHRTASPTPPKRVLVYKADNDPTRGDMHGYDGIVGQLATLMQATVTEVDDAALAALYPNMQPGETSLKKYISENGAPDVFFGKCSDRFKNFLYDGGTRQIEDILNETYARLYVKNPELVPHHITAEMLTEAEKNLEATYPGLPQPLIAVFMADASKDEVKDCVEKLTGIVTQYPKASIFVCTSWRTPDHVYKDFMTQMDDALKHTGLENHTTLTGFNLNLRRAAGDSNNPYPGLLQRCDHAIVWGNSHSMVSEVLATGKTVYTLAAVDVYQHTRADGLADCFKTHPAGAPLETRQITPVDVTKQIAQQIYKQYRRAPNPNSFITRLIRGR